MRRRHWLVAVALLVGGCSSGKTKSKKSSRSRSSSGRPKTTSGRNRLNKGPQGFGGMLVDDYVDDLKNGSADQKITAARQLGNMGSNAKEALPELERLTGDKNPQVSAAAKSAVGAIKKR